MSFSKVHNSLKVRNRGEKRAWMYELISFSDSHTFHITSNGNDKCTCVSQWMSFQNFHNPSNARKRNKNGHGCINWCASKASAILQMQGIAMKNECVCQLANSQNVHNHPKCKESQWNINMCASTDEISKCIDLSRCGVPLSKMVMCLSANDLSDHPQSSKCKESQWHICMCTNWLASRTYPIFQMQGVAMKNEHACIRRWAQNTATKCKESQWTTDVGVSTDEMPERL